MEGLFALTSWDIVIDVLELVANRAKGNLRVNCNPKRSFLLIFVNNEVVVEMIFKGRSCVIFRGRSV